MAQAISTFSYDFEKSYYENFWSNRYSAMRNGGQFNEAFTRLWGAYNSTKTVDGVDVDDGVDIKLFVQYTYNGDTTLCMIDAMVQAITDIIGSVIGCGIANAIFDIVDAITDLFGSFICTATVEALGTECGESFLTTLKSYRDEEMMTYREGLNMVRYYTVIGPRIVEAIESDIERHTVYAYLWNTYIEPLGTMVKGNEKEKIILTYFTMMDEMVKRYKLDVSPKFDHWVEESLVKYKEVLDEQL